MDGVVEPGFERVAEVFREQLGKARGGGAVCVYHKGKPVIDLWGGQRNEQGDPWQADTLSVSFSTTKGITATLAHQLAQKGAIDYDTPVMHYWPEFGARGKKDITVRDLLTHRSGLYDMRQLGLDFEQMLDWDEVTRRLADARPDHSRRPHSIYHALSYGWLVGEVIRRATGTPIAELVQRELAQPLGLDGLFIGVPDHEHHRVAELIMGRPPGAARKPQTLAKALRKDAMKLTRDTMKSMAQRGLAPDFSPFARAVHVKGFHPRKLTSAPALRASMPAVNGVFTARSLARLYAALANGGELDGQRILDDHMLPVISEQQVHSLDRALFSPMRWRLGYHQPFVFSLKRPARGFGHFGFGGSGAWADPDRKLAVALTVNAGTGTPWGDMRILKVGAAALKAARKAA